MKEKIEKKIIYFFIVFVGLYFIGYCFLSGNEKFTTRYYQKLSNRSEPMSSDYIGHRQEVYEATYTCYSKDGQKHTLIAWVYPQNPNIPKDYYGTIEDRCAESIRDYAEELDIKLKDGFENDIMIAQIYK